MKYNKKLFIDNINYLVAYDYEPEIAIVLKNNEQIFLIAYKDFIDVTLSSNETMRLQSIDELFNYIDIKNVIKIHDAIDHQFPIETQSIVVDNKLWIDMELPKDVFKKYRKQFSLHRYSIIIFIVALLVYTLVTFLNTEKFDLFIIVLYSLIVISIIVIGFGFTLFDVKRNKIIKKYYGVVSEEDKLTAKQLLDDIDVLDNEYEFFDLFYFDSELSVIKQCLTLIIKGKKVYKGLSNIIFDINNEIKNNNINNKYNDIKYNNYIEEVCNLIELNNVDI